MSDSKSIEVLGTYQAPSQSQIEAFLALITQIIKKPRVANVAQMSHTAIIEEEERRA